MLVFGEKIIKVYTVSIDSNQDCVYDDLESLKDELENFEFTEKEIKEIIVKLKLMNIGEEKEFSNDNLYCIKIKCSEMSNIELNNLPEFNGW